MKVSIITPTNRLGGLKLNLLGLSKQTFPKNEFEVIIIDDYPHPFTLAPFEYGLNIKYLRSKPASWRSNCLIANARNTGLIHATGELVIFLDDYSWVRSSYIEENYKTFKEGYCAIGPVTRIEYTEDLPEDPSTLEWKDLDSRLTAVPPHLKLPWESDWTKWKEHRFEWKNCPGGWFYTSNASAPLNKIVEVNGFWEIADLTREEDVLLGLALEKAGCKFWFKSLPETNVFHMDHANPQFDAPRRFRNVSYEDLGWVAVDGIIGLGGEGKCGLDTKPDETQLITRDIYNTKYPGSWGLIEHWQRTGHRFNSEIGFDLKAERMKVGL